MISRKTPKKIFFAASIFFILFYFTITKAESGNYVNFSINSSFDLSERAQIQAVLVKTGSNLYFYVEKSWWDLQILQKRNEILANLDSLSAEFDSKIYPVLSSVFGQEWKPGVDGDNKIIILFHPMKTGVGGYFRSTDEYIKLQVPDSNEREMVYLPISEIESSRLKIFLAHEFVHLITFNQKDRLNGVQEEVWLNEARADYAQTILGYNDIYEGSNLQRRVKDFLEKPSDSLTEWQETKYDYAAADIFSHYLVDHYGINMLSDSLRFKLVGIASINEVLIKSGYKENFSQIFTDWTITMAINNCQVSLKYCYLNKNLANLRIGPSLNFLPLVGNSSLSVINVTKNWSGNWQKIIGGNGNLKLEFQSLPELDFKVPYIVFDKDNSYSVNFLQLDKDEKGEINIKDFGIKYSSLVVLPSLQTKTSGFNGFEFTYPYNFTVSITREVEEEEVLIQKLLAQIEDLKKKIAALQKNPGGSSQNNDLCFQLNGNLYFGVSGSSGNVKCLQHFLKNQGKEIYPEGLVTGYFGSLTRAAVIRFQNRYGIPATGFVGILTRTKINQLMK